MNYGFDLLSIKNFTNINVLQKTEKEVVEFIELNKNNKSIVCWNLGANTLSNLKNNYDEPMLSMQRNEYLNFINNLSAKIKLIDNRPVSIHAPLDERTDYFINKIYKMAPNVDLIGLGLHYTKDSQYLETEALKELINDKRVYLSSFGIDDYSDNLRNNKQEYRDLDSTIIANELIENSDNEKTVQLLSNLKIINDYNLIGGFYNSWTDKMDGTFTWSGLTDYRALLKPNYHVVKNHWSSDSNVINFPEIDRSDILGMV